MTAPFSPGYEITRRILDDRTGRRALRQTWDSIGVDIRQEIAWSLERIVNHALQNGTVQILVGCQVEACAESVSLYLDMVRMWKGSPICEPCFTEAYCDGSEAYIQWAELPRVTMLDLKE